MKAPGEWRMAPGITRTIHAIGKSGSMSTAICWRAIRRDFNFRQRLPLRRWRVRGMRIHNGKLPFVERLSALFACGGVTQEPANGTGERIRAQLPGAVGTSAMLRLERLPWSGPHPRKAGQGSDAAKWKPPPPAGRKALGPTHANRGQYRGTQRPR